MGRVVSLAGTIVATRLLAPELFGQLSAVLLVAATFASVATLGLGVAVTKRVAEFRARDPERVGGLARLALKMVLISGVTATAALILGRHWMAGTWLHSPALATEVGLASVLVLTSSLFAVEIGILTGFEAFSGAAVANSIRSILSALLLVCGIEIAGVNGAILGTVLGEAVAVAWAAVTISKFHVPGGDPVFGRVGVLPGTWKPLLRLGMPALGAGIALSLSLLIGQRILAGQPDGFVAVAQFNVAYRWSLVILFIPAALSPVMTPLLANLAGANAHVSFRRLVRANFVILCLVTVLPALVMIIARQFVLGLSGSDYQSDTLAFVILIAGTLPVALNTLLSQTALALDAIFAWFISDVVLALALVASAVALAPRYLAAGLASAYVIGYLATCTALAVPVWIRVRGLGADLSS